MVLSEEIKSAIRNSIMSAAEKQVSMLLSVYEQAYSNMPDGTTDEVAQQVIMSAVNNAHDALIEQTNNLETEIKKNITPDAINKILGGINNGK